MGLILKDFKLSQHVKGKFKSTYTITCEHVTVSEDKFQKII